MAATSRLRRHLLTLLSFSSSMVNIKFLVFSVKSQLIRQSLGTNGAGGSAVQQGPSGITCNRLILLGSFGILVDMIVVLFE